MGGRVAQAAAEFDTGRAADESASVLGAIHVPAGGDRAELFEWTQRRTGYQGAHCRLQRRRRILCGRTAEGELENGEDKKLFQPFTIDQATTTHPPHPASDTASILSATSTLRNTQSLGVKIDAAQVEYGVSVDLNVRSRRVRDLVNVLRTENQEVKLPDPAAAPAHRFDRQKSQQIAQLTSEFTSEAVRKSLTLGGGGGNSNVPESGGDLESMQSLVDYTRHHDALMAFYYMDDRSGQMKVTEIFGVGKKEGSPILFHPTIAAGAGSNSASVSRRHSAVQLANGNFDSNSSASMANAVGFDSGVETSATRDACTSPILGAKGGVASR